MSTTLRFHPASRRPALATGVMLGLGFLGGAAWAALPEPAVVAPLALVMGVSLLPFYAPTDYRFDKEAVEVRRLGIRKRHPWSRFASFQEQRNGLVLLPKDSSQGLRALRRAVFLPMDAELRALALPLVQKRLPRK